MAEARIQITADTSQFNSGISGAINDLDKLKKKQDEVNQNTTNNLNKTSAAYGKANKGLQDQNKLTKQSLGGLKTTESSINKLGSAADSSGKKVKGFGKIGGVFKKIGAAAKAFLLSPVGLIITAITALGAAFTKSIAVQRKFQSSLAELQAITGATNQELEFYRETAKDIAADKTLSTNINETVNAFKLVGSAKPELLAVKEDLAEVTKQAILLSKASGDTLESSVNSLTDTLNQYNLGAEEAGRVTNILAAGSKFGAAAVPQITDALVKFGVAAKSSNISVEESVGAIETLAEKGVKGAEAGIQLRNVFNKLSATDILPKQAIDRLVQAGVDVEGLSDKTLSLEDRFKLLAPIQDDANALTAVFGAESKNAAQILIQNTEALGNYTEAVQTQGVAQDQANINAQTFDSALARLGNSFDALLAGSGTLVEALTPVINILADVIDWVGGFGEAIFSLDFDGIAAGFLDIADVLTWGLIPQLGDAADKYHFLSEVTNQVVDGIQDQATGLAELTTLLGRNNDAIADGNLTQEEQTKLQEENSEIIKQLRNEYPELTAMVDLQTASSQELKEATAELTKQFVASAIQEAKAAKQKELINQLIQNQIDLSRAEAEGKTGVLGFFSEVDDLKEAGKDIEKQLKNINEDFADAEANINGLGIDFAAGINAELSALDTAKERLEEFSTTLAVLRGEIDESDLTGIQKIDLAFNFDTEEALEAKIAAQEQIILDQEKKKNAIIKKENSEARQAEQQAINEANKKAAAKASKKAIEEAKKLAEARRKLLIDSENEINDILADLLDRRLELEADTEAKKILLKEKKSLEELALLESTLKDQLALQKVASELGQSFIEKASEEELQIQIDKYSQQVLLTEEQEQLIADLRLGITQETNKELQLLELENQAELLSISEESAATKFAILEKQELAAIEDVNATTELSELQKQMRILDIQETAAKAKIKLINEEFDAKEDQIRNEIELLKVQGDEISLVKAQQLEETIALNNLERQETIDGINDQVQAAKDAAAELNELAAKISVDSVIGKIFGTDNPDEIQAIKDVFKELVGNIVEIYKQGIQQQLEEQQKIIDGLDEQISKQEEVVQKEKELQEEGNANSRSLEEKRLAELQAQREEAAAQQKELQEQQQRAETVTQTASLITASANIFKSLSGLGVAGIILAGAAVASMFAAFIQTKKAAKEATAKFEKGGNIIAGKRHSQGGEMLLDHVEVEAGEQVSILSRGATSKFGRVMQHITDEMNAGRMPVLPNNKIVQQIKMQEDKNFEAKFDAAVNNRVESLLKSNNQKLDTLISAIKGQPNRYSAEGKTIERKGSTTKIKRR